MLPARTSTKAQKTRALILDSALLLFREKGFESTTMRDIAQKASMAVGATYYHFRTKDEIVLAFYESTQDGSEERARHTNAQTKDFSARLKDALEWKLEQLGGFRDFLGQLACHALDMKSPLSPFSQETKILRTRAISIFENILRGSDLKVAKEIEPHLPRLLWLYQMAIIHYWLNDSSKNFEQTKKLLLLTHTIILRMLSLSRVPIFRPLNKMVLSLLEFFPNTK